MHEMDCEREGLGFSHPLRRSVSPPLLGEDGDGSAVAGGVSRRFSNNASFQKTKTE